MCNKNSGKFKMAETKKESHGDEFACECKIGTLTEKYGLEGMHRELADKWAGVGGDSTSVRTLTKQFNKRILRAEMTNAGMDIVDGRVENFYRLLSDDDVLDAIALQAKTLLEENGVDSESLVNEFVSHQTIYRHLRNCLEVDKETESITIDTERSRLNRLQNRSAAVIDDSVSRLRRAGEISLDEHEVLVNFRVTCEACGKLHDVADLLDQNGCHCQGSTDSV